jgi:hypothetical protein
MNTEHERENGDEMALSTSTLERRHEGPKRARLSVTLAPGLVRALREAAAEQGLPLTHVIEDTLAERFSTSNP